MCCLLLGVSLRQRTLLLASLNHKRTELSNQKRPLPVSTHHFLKNNFIYLFHGCAGCLMLLKLFSSCEARAVAPLVADHGLCSPVGGPPGSRAQAQQLRLPGLVAVRHMWDLPWSGVEPVSPALAGRFFTTELPGKPSTHHFKEEVFWSLSWLSHWG